MEKGTRKPLSAQRRKVNLSDSETAEIKQSIEYLRKAVSKMNELDIPATPQNYSLWYTYFANKNADLVAVLTQYLNENTVFTAETNQILYLRFFGQGEDDQLVAIRNAIRSLIALLHSHLNQLDQGMEGYEKALKSCEESLKSDPDINTLNKLLSTLVAETQKSRASNKKAQKNIAQLQSEIEEMQQSLERLSEEALEDALTGVANRRGFDQALEKLIRSKKTDPKAEHCLLLLDIDRFKLVNDKHGHLVGDRVLRFVAQMVKKSIKGRDLVARFGGEEFAIIFPNTNYDGGVAIANGIIKGVANQKLTLNKKGLKLGKVTLSGGLSLIREDDTANELIERVDRCLYQAKTNGRNTIVGEDALDQGSK